MTKHPFFAKFFSPIQRLRKVAALLRPAREEAAEAAPLERPYPWEASYPDGIDWNLTVDPKPLYTILDDAVERYADNRCLEFLGKQYTYKEVGQLVARAARGLQDIGLKKGDRVGLFLPNTPYYVICYYAILKAGGTVVNFNPMYAEREIARQIEDSRTRFMITLNLGALYPKVAAQLGTTCLEKIVVCLMRGILPFPNSALFPLVRRKELASIPNDDQHVKFAKLIASDQALDRVPVDPMHDIALLQYTGGTTGTPKGAMLTHANLYANTLQTQLWAPGVRPGEEKLLAVLPLFHVFGMTGVMNVGLNTGAEIILLPRFKVAEALKVIDKERPTVLLAVPTIYSAINGHKELEKYDVSSLEYCISGGAALPLEIKQKFEALTGCTLVEGYGLSESAPVCTINPFGGLNKPGSAGLPVPGTLVEIVSLEDPSRLLPIGEKGEICVSGPQVMVGYAGQEDETADALLDGRLHTGDVGYMDEDGYLYIIDRIKDLIITGGFNVYPRMVEEAVHLHPEIEDVAVCGVPSRHHGEIVKAYVILSDGAEMTAVELRTFLKDKLAPYEMPRQVEFTDEIPKTLLGKPLRRELIAAELRRAKEEEAAETVAAH